jgi:hypothetical protein
MLGGVSDEKAREVKTTTIVLDTATRILFRLVHIYDDISMKEGSYKSSILQAVVTSANDRLVPVQLQTYLHDEDRRRYQALAEISDDEYDRRSASNANRKKASLRRLFYGFTRHHDGERLWQVGMLDRLGFILGGFNSPLRPAYVSREMFIAVKQRLRVTDEAAIASYKGFRGRMVMEMLLRNKIPEIRQSVAGHEKVAQEEHARMQRRRRRGMAARTTEAPANNKQQNRTQKPKAKKKRAQRAKPA